MEALDLPDLDLPELPDVELPELPDIGMVSASVPDAGVPGWGGWKEGDDVTPDYIQPPRRSGRQLPVLYDRAVDMVREIGPAIAAGDRVDVLLSGNFIFGDFFEALLVEGNAKADELVLSTLSLSQDNVDSLENLIRGDYLGHLDIIVSDYWYSHNRRNLRYIYEHLDQDGRFRFAVAGIHTKIALLTIGDRKIVVHGSANLRSSRSVEVVTIETNPELYAFHRRWHESILRKYNTVTGAVRAADLYDIIRGG